MPAYHSLVEKQRAFFRSGATRSLESRRNTLQQLKKLVEEDGEELAAAVFADIHRSGAIEVAGLNAAVNEAIDKLEEWSAPQKIAAPGILDPNNDEMLIVREPLGVVLVISPWNFPIITSVPFVQALAAGNTVILKPSELAAHTALVFEKLIKKYFSEEVFAVVNGAVAETTDLLTERFDHIVYTGNPGVAKVIMAAAAKHLTPVTLELGGKNPTVVLDDADVQLAATKIVGAKLLNCGQICINPDYVLTTEATKPKLVDALKTAFEKQGNLAENPSFARIINERHFDRLSSILTKTSGKLLWQAQGEADRAAKFLPPRIYEITPDDEFMKDEIFGPFVTIITVKSLDEAIDFIKIREKPLAAYIFTTDAHSAERFIRETSSGGCCVNDVQIHAFVNAAPFGGVGNSGLGRINGKYSFDNFTHEKSTVIRGNLHVPHNKL